MLLISQEKGGGQVQHGQHEENCKQDVCLYVRMNFLSKPIPSNIFFLQETLSKYRTFLNIPEQQLTLVLTQS